jgi:hypothetical protein
MNIRDVGSETNVNDTVQTNKNDKKKPSKMLAQRYQKKMLKCNKNNYKSFLTLFMGDFLMLWDTTANTAVNVKRPQTSEVTCFAVHK